MVAKYLVIAVDGEYDETLTVSVSAGAGDVDKIPSLNALGVLDPSILNGTVVSVGSGSAAKFLQLGSNGLLDASVMPTGIGADARQIVCTENLAAGAVVNEYFSSGAKVRNADASTRRKAHGFVRQSYTSGQTALVYFDSVNDQLSGLTPGKTMFLGAAGAVTETVPTTSGYMAQPVGTAISATEISFVSGRAITRA